MSKSHIFPRFSLHQKGNRKTQTHLSNVTFYLGNGQFRPFLPMFTTQAPKPGSSTTARRIFTFPRPNPFGMSIVGETSAPVCQTMYESLNVTNVQAPVNESMCS